MFILSYIPTALTVGITAQYYENYKHLKAISIFQSSVCNKTILYLQEPLYVLVEYSRFLSFFVDVVF